MDLIEIIILVAIVISGTVFGSFFTLAVHRIPRKEDITHERSYCPKCNHKLQFLDLIPVWSYLFLGGKCRYCKSKIRPRYFILEIFSGFIFLLIGLSYGISVETTIYEFINFAILILFLCSVFIIAGIDKEKYMIPNGLLVYGFGISIIKLIFNGFVLNHSIYSNIMGFIVLPLMLFIINFAIKKIFNLSNEKLPFGVGDIKYLAILGLFGGFGIQIMIFEVSLLLIFIYKLYEKLMRKENKEIAWGFYLSIASAILLAIMPNITDLIDVFNSLILF